MTIQELKLSFQKAYSKDTEAVYFSLGRVNLIGEHTDDWWWFWWMYRFIGKR